jgi:hypothetical protein
VVTLRMFSRSMGQKEVPKKETIHVLVTGGLGFMCSKKVYFDVLNPIGCG